MGLNSFVIKKGSYMSELVENYVADLSQDWRHFSAAAEAS